MRTLRTIAFTYLILLVLTLFVFLLVPRAYSAPFSTEAGLQSRSPQSLTHSNRSSGSCRDLVEEMSQMKKAQNQIINSLARNHDTFADQLSDLSFELALYKKTVPQKALESMDKSAQAYRVRAHKAQVTAQKLDDLTTDLIDRLEGCLR